MARPHTVQPAGVALHVIQRARGACFSGDADRIGYLRRLRGHAQRVECAIHAYALMGNHVHLLLTPARPDGAGSLMDALREPPGVRWEEGFDASPVHARQYLFACMRYIESNPQRARLVARPGGYRWSSYRANAMGRVDALVTPHPLYYALGRTPGLRQAAYRALFLREGAVPARAVYAGRALLNRVGG